MANGKPGDSPITDLLMYGGNPFPPDVTRMVRRLHEIRPERLSEIGLQTFAWERGEDLDGARAWLRRALSDAGDREPVPTLAAHVDRWWRVRLALRRFVRGPLRRWLRPLLTGRVREGPPPGKA